MPDADDYALVSAELEIVAAPEIAYEPPMPAKYRPRIGLIGAGGISGAHLDAYRKAGWEVAVICDRTRAKAAARADEFFPQAQATDRQDDIFADPSIEIIDITTHPADRVQLIERALNAGKHVLSQKPFVLDLKTGERLCDLADKNGRFLAINQNGRWSPHMAWMRKAVATGLIGDLISAHISIHWNHNWVAGTPFDKIEDLVLYDFGIHWFDFLTTLLPSPPKSVFAMSAKATDQSANVPLLAQVLVRLQDGQASLVFDGAAPFGPRDTTYLAGTKGSIASEGPDLGQQKISLFRDKTVATPALNGTWFNDGFIGAMGELLCAVEEDRQPENNARDNLESLALSFAAMEARRSGRETAVGSVRSITI